MAGNDKKTTSPQTVLAREREARAILLRKAGANYTQIASQLDITRGAAYKAVKRALGRVIKECNEDAEDVRQLELARLDEMLFGIWPVAKGGDLKAIETVLKIEKRRAELLGIDAPVKMEIPGVVVVAPPKPPGEIPDWVNINDQKQPQD